MAPPCPNEGSLLSDWGSAISATIVQIPARFTLELQVQFFYHFVRESSGLVTLSQVASALNLSEWSVRSSSESFLCLHRIQNLLFCHCYRRRTRSFCSQSLV